MMKRDVFSALFPACPRRTSPNPDIYVTSSGLVPAVVLKAATHSCLEARRGEKQGVGGSRGLACQEVVPDPDLCSYTTDVYCLLSTPAAAAVVIW